MSHGVEQLGPRASKTKEQPKTPDDVKNVRAVASPPRPSGHVCSAAAGAGSFPDRRDERRQGIVLQSPTNGEVAASLPQGGAAALAPSVSRPRPGNRQGSHRKRLSSARGRRDLSGKFRDPFGDAGSKTGELRPSATPPDGRESSM